ncbi:hypothetical protein R75461_07750 [Paraburkholderia nemoris]|uniref:hypothetical protein n=1 Tax=Paraburkholderia nemoris TaxID=2793076 RepID=UPI00190B62C2|nr:MULTISPECIES: hypothetical protein [Paraburkholderia]MBK3786551.1 hypothetical protein [Paraburkholderia aspalathi]CAE6856724.1 hypothetical protein R75461_07750 [Paraburkholderia nemoris]
MSHFPTLNELIAMDDQAMFDHIARHLLSQARRCTEADPNQCLYRDGHGGACAVGAIIPDALYCPTMEHKNLHALIEDIYRYGSTDQRVLAAVLQRNHGMLRALQHMHDGQPVHEWPRSLAGIADAYGLCDEVVTRLAPHSASRHDAIVAPAWPAHPAREPVSTMVRPWAFESLMQTVLAAPDALPPPAHMADIHFFSGAHHGCEEREEAREVSCA